MKADGVLNLLKFQRFQSVRMTSSLVRSTKMKRSETLVISTITRYRPLLLYHDVFMVKWQKKVKKGHCVS